MIDPSAIPAAAARLQGVVNRTPVHTSRTLDERAGCRIFLKCESFQRVGAFKFRGAYHAVSQLSDAERRAGVITHSSGNHAQALALAARLHGARAVVVMPRDAPPVKREATAGYGAEIVPCDAVDRERVCAELIERHGHTLVHPYDDDRIIAGQGTAAWELTEDVGDLELLLTPLGGGGLLAGTALAAAARGGPRVVGVEPETADDGRRSFLRGEVVTLPEVPSTVADGLRTRHVGERNLAVMKAHVDDVVTVSEEEIREALRLCWQRLKLVIEPSAAVPVAALLAGRVGATAKRVGVILSGGNVDLDALPF